MKTKIREMSWFKRREPTKEIKAVSVESITGFEMVDNHRCEVGILFDDGKIYDMSGRVLKNDIKGTWIIHAINPTGQSVILDIIEE